MLLHPRPATATPSPTWADRTGLSGRKRVARKICHTPQIRAEGLHGRIFTEQHENLISKVKFAPYIHFADGCAEHKLLVREWGAYLLLAKDEYVDRPQMLWGASGYRTGRDLYLVIGNMMNHRKNWLIIKTFEVDPPDTSPSLLDGIEDGQSE